jgi:radical SAM protein with 4Fe4S-binding SPASM domain
LLESTLHPVSRWVFIRNGDDYLLYSDQAPSMIPVDSCGKALIELMPRGGSLFDWIETAARTHAIEPEDALRRIHPLATAMQKAGLLGFDRAPKPVDWISKLVEMESKGSRTCYLSLTDTCNLACSYCYNKEERTESLTYRLKPLSDQEIRDFIDRLVAARFEYIVFTGGEPMLRKSIFVLGSYAKERGLGVNLLTNGTLFSKRNAGRAAEIFDSITVSLDSSYSHEHDTIRGRGSWHRIVNGLDRLISAGAHSIALRPVITNHNVDNLHLVPDFAYRRWGITHFEPCLYLPSSMYQMQNLALLPDVETYRYATERFALELRKIPGAHADNPLKSISYGGKCGMANSIMSVSASGDVYPCQALHYRAFWMGNVRHNSIEELFRNGQGLGIVGASGLDTPECQECPFLMLCGGGCRANVFQLYGKITAYNKAMCHYLKSGAEDQLRRYANHWLGRTDRPVMLH